MQSKSKLLLITSTGVVIVLVASLGVLAGQPSATGSIAPSSALPGGPRSVTLLEARERLRAYARASFAAPEIAFLSSAYHPEETASAGGDGHRRSWLGLVVDQGGTRSRWVRLVDGVVAEEADEPRPENYVPLTGNLAIDSPEAVMRATAAKPSLRAADDGSTRGFGFVLESSASGSLTVSVVGTVGDMPALVQLDAATGALLVARQLVLRSGGILHSNDAGQTWRASRTAPSCVSWIIADPAVQGRGYAVATEGGRIVVSQTQDGGEEWTPLGGLPAESGNWPYSLCAAGEPDGRNRLFVGTSTGLWVSSDGSKWQVVPGLPVGPKQWVAAAQSKVGYRLLVSVTAGDHTGTYASSDLAKWVRLTDRGCRMSASYDRRSVLLTDEQSTRGLVVGVAGETEAVLPNGTLRVVGDFGAPTMVVGTAAHGVGPWSRGQGTWTLSVPVAALAAAPDYPVSGVAVAGGFRTGIYRTEDAGATWKQALEDPSAIVPGSGEICSVVFLSTTDVVAANGGQLTWCDF